MSTPEEETRLEFRLRDAVGKQETIAEFCASVADEFDPAVGAAIRERYERARRDAPS
jgi:hypothetical protein